MRALIFAGLACVFAMRAAAVAAPPPLEAYGRLPAVEDVALSPGGGRIALVLTQGDQRLLADYDIATQKSQIVAHLESVKARAVAWIDDSHILVLWTKTISTAITQKFTEEYSFASIVNTATGKSVMVFKDVADYKPFVFGPFVPTHIGDASAVFVSNIYFQGDFPRNLFLVDPDTGRPRLVDSGRPGVNAWAVSAEGKVVARSELEPATGVWTLSFRQPNGFWKPVYHFQQLQGETDVGYLPELFDGLGRDGKSAVIFIPNRTGFGDYVEITPDGTLSAPFTGPNGLGGPIFDRKTRRLIGFSPSAEHGAPVYLDPADQALWAHVKKSAPGLTVHIVSQAEDPNKLIFSASGQANAGGYYYVDYGQKTSLAIGDVYPDVPADWVAEQKRIAFKAADGLNLHGFVTLPPGRDPKGLPLIVLPHGGPRAHDAAGFDWWAQALASRGYAVLQVNYRGSDGYGAKFERAGYGQWGRKMQTDLSDGVRYLAAKGLIDPKRVCIVGASYGGYAALAGAALDPGVYVCAAAVAGVSDLPAMMQWQGTGDVNSTTDRYWRQLMGPASGWSAISPLRQIDKIQIPILLVHGKDDTVVPIDQSLKMRDALKRAGKTVDYVELPGEDHWLSKSATRLRMLKAVVAFVEKYNPPS